MIDYRQYMKNFPELANGTDVQTLSHMARSCYSCIGKGGMRK